jgi:hypothetical protein
MADESGTSAEEIVAVEMIQVVVGGQGEPVVTQPKKATPR